MMSTPFHARRGPRPGTSRRKYVFTALYLRADDGGYIAYAEELYGVDARGVSLEEAEKNLQAAIALYLESNRRITREAYAMSRPVLRKLITVGIDDDRKICGSRGEA
jgi:predicted RNase H-like HicB family nuclease